MKSTIEKVFETWSDVVVARPLTVLLVTLLLTGAVISQITRVWIDVSSEAFLPSNSTEVVDYDDFRLQFDSGSSSVIALKFDDTVFTLENLQRLKTMHEDIEATVPHVDDITSLVSVSHINGTDEGLEVKDLVEVWPTTESEIPAFKEMVLSNPNYVNNIISPDGHYAAIVILLSTFTSEGNDDDMLGGFDDDAAEEQTLTKEHFLTGEEQVDNIEKTLEIIEKYRAKGYSLIASGGDMTTYQLTLDMGKMLTMNMVYGMIVVVLLLWLLFQRLSGVLLPVLIVGISITTTLAMMPIFGVPITATTQVLPTFLLAVGIADAVHILSVFYKRFDECGDKFDAIKFSIHKTAVAVLMTTLTTAAGLLSFSFADLEPTQSLGIYGAVGVALALIFTLTLIPSLLALSPLKVKKVVQSDDKQSASLSKKVMQGVDDCIFWLGNTAMERPKLVASFYLGLTLIACVGLTKINMSHDEIRWYPEEHPIRAAVEVIDGHLSGTRGLEITLDTGRENGLYEPEVLRFIESIEQLAYEYQVYDLKALKVNSILNVVKQNHQALNANDPEFYAIPDDRLLIAQELLLFENSGSDDLEEFTDNNFRTARITVMLPNRDMLYFRDYLEGFAAEIDALQSTPLLQEIEYNLVGGILVGVKILILMITSALESYLLAFSLVGLLMFLLMGSVRRGMLAFIPNIVPIFFTLGMMGWAGIPLNVLTSLLGCVVIGISVDDTIHFIHHYKDSVTKGATSREAILYSLGMSGRAITFTSIVLVGCFMIYAADVLLPSIQFGILLSFAILIALFANLMLSPALLTLFWKRDK